MAKSDLTASRLREVLDYNPLTGQFFWRVFRSGRALAGQQAAREPKCHGYSAIFVDGYLYAAHRLAWLHVTGEWPKGLIDHRDGNKANNVFSNLRDVSFNANMENRRKAHSNNRSGLLGVSIQNKGRRRFQARIQVNKRLMSLGYFKTAEEAHAAYLEAKRRLHEGCTI